MWDRYLPALIFACGEAPVASMGFPPFELLHGRSVTDLLTILKELWDKEGTVCHKYVFKLREKLEQTCRLVQDQLKYKAPYDRSVKGRQFRVGDSVVTPLN